MGLKNVIEFRFSVLIDWLIWKLILNVDAYKSKNYEKEKRLKKI